MRPKLFIINFKLCFLSYEYFPFNSINSTKYVDIYNTYQT